jgi:PPOX class probable F420-dependent enzyme
VSLDLSALEFIRPNKRAVMITRRKDDRLQTSVVTAVYNPAGQVWVWTRPATAKIHNLKRDPRATLCVVDEHWHEWLHVDGNADLVQQPEALTLLDDYYRLREGKDHPNWGEWRQRMIDEGRQLFRITPTNVFKPPRAT